MRDRGVEVHFVRYGHPSDRVTLSACGRHVKQEMSTFDVDATTCRSCMRSRVFQNAGGRGTASDCGRRERGRKRKPWNVRASAIRRG